MSSLQAEINASKGKTMDAAPERIWATNDNTGYRFSAYGDQPKFESVEYIRADLAKPRVRPLVWDIDGRKLSFDDTMAMGKGYDWHGFEIMRQEAYGLAGSYMIWPDHISSTSFNLYGTADGLYIQNMTENEAKGAAQADHEARILGALE